MGVYFAIGSTHKIAIIIVAGAFLWIGTIICTTTKYASQLVIEICLNKFRRSYTFV